MADVLYQYEASCDGRLKVVLTNGENCHPTVKPKEWWLEQVAAVFGHAEVIRDYPQEPAVHVITWEHQR